MNLKIKLTIINKKLLNREGNYKKKGKPKKTKNKIKIILKQNNFKKNKKGL